MIRTAPEHDNEDDCPTGTNASSRTPRSRYGRWLLMIILLQLSLSSAEPIRVRYPEGTAHGFLALRNMQGKLLASGDLIETVEGSRVTTRLVFHFKDGSLDDETTVFSQHGTFRLISDHHIQKGPSYPDPTNISIDASTGQVTVRYKEKNQEKVDREHMDLPADLANGLLLVLLKNISPGTKETRVSYVGGVSKPRLVHLSITPASAVTFTVAGATHKATPYTLKVEIGGLAGLIAPLVGKEPTDVQIWIVNEGAPAFVRADGALYLGGPIWSIQMSSPEWSGTTYHGHKQ